MTAGSSTTPLEPSGSFPFDAVMSRCLVWQDPESKRRFAVLSEPTNDGLTTQRAAEAVVIRIWESLRELRHHDPVDAAWRALNNAHQTVRRANLLPGGQRRADLGLVGVSLCVIEGNQMVLAIAAPAQAFLLQDGLLEDWPKLSERRHEFAFGESLVDSLPLGGAIFQPAISVTDIEPGDRVLLCSDAVAEKLVQQYKAFPTKLLEKVAGIMGDEPIQAEIDLRELVGSGRANLATMFAPADPATSDGEPPHFVVRTQSPEAMARIRNTMEPEKDTLVAEVTPPVPVEERVITPVLASKKPGNIVPLSSQVFTRYQPESSPLRESLRVWMPRGPWEAIPLWSVGVVILLLLSFAGGAKLYQRQQHRIDEANGYLAEVDLQLSTLGVGGDSNTLKDQVTAAEAALQKAKSYGASDSAINQRESQLVTARDRINNITRLQSVQALGALPTAAEHPHLVTVGDTIYLINSAVYRIDAKSGQLVQLLAQGDKVGKATVDTIKDATTDGTSLIATDGVALYTLQDNQSWKRTALGLRESKQPWEATAVGAFEGAWYLLNGDAGSILRFDPDHLDNVPGDWTQGNYRSDLSGAVDFAIDGYIYVVTSQNKLVVLYKGSELSPEGGLPAITNPIAIYGGVGTSYVWVLEELDGTPTLVRINRDGFTTVTYQLPYDWNAGEGLNDLSKIKDFVVLENAGEVIFVTNDAVWQASVPFVQG